MIFSCVESFFVYTIKIPDLSLPPCILARLWVILIICLRTLPPLQSQLRRKSQPALSSSSSWRREGSCLWSNPTSPHQRLAGTVENDDFYLLNKQGCGSGSGLWCFFDLRIPDLPPKLKPVLNSWNILSIRFVLILDFGGSSLSSAKKYKAYFYFQNVFSSVNILIFSVIKVEIWTSPESLVSDLDAKQNTAQG
jgi:hypothetical protein